MKVDAPVKGLDSVICTSQHNMDPSLIELGPVEVEEVEDPTGLPIQEQEEDPKGPSFLL